MARITHPLRRSLSTLATLALMSGLLVGVQSPVAAQQSSAGNCDYGDVSIPLGTMIDSQGYRYDTNDERVDVGVDGWSAFATGHTCTVNYPTTAPTDQTEVTVAIHYEYPDLDYNRNGIADDPLPDDSCYSNAELSGAVGTGTVGTGTALLPLTDKTSPCVGKSRTDYDGLHSPGATFGTNKYSDEQAGSAWGSSISVNIAAPIDGELNSYDLGSWIVLDDGSWLRSYRRVMVSLNFTWSGGSESVPVFQIKDNENDAGPVGSSTSTSTSSQGSTATPSSYTWPAGSGCTEPGVIWSGTDVTLCFVDNDLGGDSDPWGDKNWTSLTDCVTGSSFYCTTWDPWWDPSPQPPPTDYPTNTPVDQPVDPPESDSATWLAGSGCTEPGVIWSGTAVTLCWAGDGLYTGLGGDSDPWGDQNWTTLTDCYRSSTPACDTVDPWW